MTVGLIKHAKGLSLARKHNPKLCDQELKKTTSATFTSQFKLNDFNPTRKYEKTQNRMVFDTIDHSESENSQN